MKINCTPQDKNNINKILQQFKTNRYDDERLFYNLCFCLCSPQVLYENNFIVIEKLEEIDFFHQNISLLSLQKKLNYVRFFERKSLFLLDAKNNFFIIKKIILNNKNVLIIREILRKKVLGLGLKTTSHFLRNMGFNDNYAIIDVHILKFLGESGNNISIKKYYALERKFCKIAKEEGLTGIELDMVVWKYYVGLEWEDFVY